MLNFFLGIFFFSFLRLFTIYTQSLFLRCSAKGHCSILLGSFSTIECTRISVCAYWSVLCACPYTLGRRSDDYMTTQHKRAGRCRCGASTHRPFALTLSTLRDLLHYLAPVAKRDFICGRVVEEVETVRGTLSALCGVLLFV